MAFKRQGAPNLSADKIEIENKYIIQLEHRFHILQFQKLYAADRNPEVLYIFQILNYIKRY